MKFTLLLATLCGAFLLGSCADNSLMSDEDYNNNKPPAPHSPDFSNALPRPVNQTTGRPY
jgi:hypothetical protein